MPKPIPLSTQKPLRGSLPVGAPVTLNVANAPVQGRVRALHVNSGGLQYLVASTDHQGRIQEDYVRPDEIAELAAAPAAEAPAAAGGTD